MPAEEFLAVGDVLAPHARGFEDDLAKLHEDILSGSVTLAPVGQTPGKAAEKAAVKPDTGYRRPPSMAMFQLDLKAELGDDLKEIEGDDRQMPVEPSTDLSHPDDAPSADRVGPDDEPSTDRVGPGDEPSLEYIDPEAVMSPEDSHPEAVPSPEDIDPSESPAPRGDAVREGHERDEYQGVQLPVSEQPGRGDLPAPEEVPAGPKRPVGRPPKNRHPRRSGEGTSDGREKSRKSKSAKKKKKKRAKATATDAKTPELPKNTEDAQELLASARNLAKMGDWDGALGGLFRVVELQPNHASAWNDMGFVWRKLDNFDEAMKCYDMAIELVPDYSLPHFNKAYSYFEAGDIKNATEWFERLLEVDPDHMEAREYLEECRDMLKRKGGK